MKTAKRLSAMAVVAALTFISVGCATKTCETLRMPAMATAPATVTAVVVEPEPQVQAPAVTTTTTERVVTTAPVSSGSNVFPSADSHTLVSIEQNGVVTVKAKGESSWIIKQYNQDNMRAGAPNLITIKSFEDAGGTMKFQLDMAGVREDGMIAFNFRKTSLPSNPWLAIPDCRVKTAGLAGMGMSYKSSDIPESGGAHFVFTGTPIPTQYPVDSSQWCDERAHVVIAPASSATKTVSAEKVSDGAMGQSVVKSPDSQNTQTKQVGGIVKVKGNNNTVTTHTKQYKAVTSNKGATVKIKGNGNNTVHACTYNINLINVGDGNAVPSAQNCGKCHNDAIWKSIKGFTDCDGKKN